MQNVAVPADHGPGSLSAAAGELRAEWAVLGRGGSTSSLWTREGAWYVQPREELIESGFPEPAALVYLCAAFHPVRDAPDWLAQVDLDLLRPSADPTGAWAFVATWADLLEVTVRGGRDRR